MSDATTHPAAQAHEQSHRGVLILVLGILGFFTFGITGLIAWILANRDLKDMDAGRRDPAGRDMTRTGRWLGIISVVLAVAGWLVWVLAAGLFFAAAT